jgi:hypothetical protein
MSALAYILAKLSISVVRTALIADELSQGVYTSIEVLKYLSTLSLFFPSLSLSLYSSLYQTHINSSINTSSI